MTFPTRLTDEQVTELLATLPPKTSDAVTPWAERLPNHPALVEASGTWTYGQLSSAISATQTWLVELGVRPGDRVMIVCENCRALAAILFAAAGVDAWPVLVNARLSAREVDENPGSLRCSTGVLHYQRLSPCHRPRQAPWRRDRRSGNGGGDHRCWAPERECHA